MQAAIKEVKGTIAGANGEVGKVVEWGGEGGGGVGVSERWRMKTEALSH